MNGPAHATMIAEEPTRVWRFPARPQSVGELRRHARAYAEAHGADAETVHVVTLAVTEAATNAVLHAFVGRVAGTITLNCEAGPGELLVAVTDDGRGMQPRSDSPGLGMGLPTMGKVATRMDVCDGPSGGGTTVRLAFRAPGVHGSNVTPRDDAEVRLLVGASDLARSAAWPQEGFERLCALVLGAFADAACVDVVEHGCLRRLTADVLADPELSARLGASAPPLRPGTATWAALHGGGPQQGRARPYGPARARRDRGAARPRVVVVGPADRRRRCRPRALGHGWPRPAPRAGRGDRRADDRSGAARGGRDGQRERAPRHAGDTATARGHPVGPRRGRERHRPGRPVRLRQRGRSSPHGRGEPGGALDGRLGDLARALRGHRRARGEAADRAAAEPQAPPRRGRLPARHAQRRPGDGATKWLRTTSRLLEDKDGPLVVNIVEDITDAVQGEHRRAATRDVGVLLDTAVASAPILQQVADRLSPALADGCAIDLLTGPGTLQRVALAHPDQDQRARLQALHEHWPALTDLPTLAAAGPGRPRVAARITDEVLRILAHDSEHLELLRAIGLRSMVVVSLRAAGRDVGQLTLTHDRTSDRTFADADVDVAIDLGRRIGMAIAAT